MFAGNEGVETRRAKTISTRVKYTGRSLPRNWTLCLKYSNTNCVCFFQWFLFLSLFFLFPLQRYAKETIHSSDALYANQNFHSLRIPNARNFPWNSLPFFQIPPLLSLVKQRSQTANEPLDCEFSLQTHIFHTTRFYIKRYGYSMFGYVYFNRKIFGIDLKFSNIHY